MLFLSALLSCSTILGLFDYVVLSEQINMMMVMMMNDDDDDDDDESKTNFSRRLKV